MSYSIHRRRSANPGAALVLVALSFLTAIGPAHTAPPPLSELEESEALADIALLKRVLERVHPGYDRFATREELEAAWGSLHAAARGGVSDGELYLEVSRLLATLRCEHTKASLPESISSWRKEEPSYLPFRVEVFGDRAFLAAVDSSQPGLAIGQELLSVDGMPTAEILAAVRPFISIDGYTEASRDVDLGFQTEYLGGGIDHFGALLHGFRGRFTVEIEEVGGGARQELSVKALDYPSWQEMATGGEARYLNFRDEVSLELLGESVALLEVGTFVNYRDPVDPDEVYGPLFRSLRERSVETLIVDLRTNGGGSDDAQLGLLRHLMTEPFLWAEPALFKTNGLGDLADVLTTWDPTALEARPEWFEPAEGGFYTLRPEIAGDPSGTLEPAPDAFTGEVILLTSTANASGSTHLIAKLKDSGRVTTVGTATGGNPTGATAGLLFTLRLPASGIDVLVPALRSRIAVTSFDDGQPIEPDVLVEPRPEDLLSGRDRVIETALLHSCKAAHTASER